MTPEQAADAISMTNVVDARARVELLDILRALQDATREECAAVCDAESRSWVGHGGAHSGRTSAASCARAIRDLKGEK